VKPSTTNHAERARDETLPEQGNDGEHGDHLLGPERPAEQAPRGPHRVISSSQDDAQGG
jgi:hypothetical protein